MLCGRCVYRLNVFYEEERELGFIGCMRSNDIIAMSPYSIDGLFNVKYFSPSAKHKIKTILMPIDDDIANTDLLPPKHGYAYLDVKYCEKYETCETLITRLRNGESIG